LRNGQEFDDCSCGSGRYGVQLSLAPLTLIEEDVERLEPSEPPFASIGERWISQTNGRHHHESGTDVLSDTTQRPESIVFSVLFFSFKFVVIVVVVVVTIFVIGGESTDSRSGRARRTSCALKVGNKNREEKSKETSGSSGRRASKQEEGE